MARSIGFSPALSTLGSANLSLSPLQHLGAAAFGGLLGVAHEDTGCIGNA